MATRAYSVAVSNAVTTAAASTQIHNMIYNDATVLVRPEIYDLVISCPATPADNVIEWGVTRTSVIPSAGGGIVVAQPLDYYSAAAKTLAWKIPGAGAVVITPYLLTMAVNTRVTWRWCAVPGGEIMIAGVVAYGAGLACVINASTPNCSTTIMFRE